MIQAVKPWVLRLGPGYNQGMFQLQLRVLPLTLLLSSPLLADPELVKDLNTGPATDPVDIAMSPWFARTVDGITYFPASDPAHGKELWRTDGTEAGTYRLTDVCPGRCNSNPGPVGVFQGRLYFSADDGYAGQELWSSAGTPGSEQRVRDLCSGPCSGNPEGFFDDGNELLFFATNGKDYQLWRTRGPRATTVPVKSFCDTSNVCARGLQRLNGQVIFLAIDGLWRTDGTAAGTVPLSIGLPWLTSDPMVADGFAFIWTQEGLWRTDGTAAGTFQLKTLAELGVDPDIYSHYSSVHTLWKGELYSALWQHYLIRSDGTVEGTVLLHEFPQSERVRSLVPLRDWLVLDIDGPTRPESLWHTNGGPVEKFFDITERAGTSDFLVDIAAIGDRAVFRTSLGSIDGLSIWGTDGTAEGTRQIEGPTAGTYPYDLVPAGDQILYRSGGYYTSTELWRTDGTEAGTRLVRDFGAGPGSAGPLDQEALGQALIFSARTSDVDAPLFRSDGTPAGTRLLSEEGSGANGLTRAGNRLFFSSSIVERDPFTGTLIIQPNGFWRTDGTPAGTTKLTDDVFGYHSPMPLGNELLFAAGSSISNWGQVDFELWRSNGTPAGTRLVKNINPYLADTGFHHICYGAPSSPGPGVAIRGRLVFAADEGINGRELWITDGTRTGTRLLRDINPARLPEPPPNCSDHPNDGRRSTGLPSGPLDLVAFRGGVLFTADDGTTGRELWWTNGTVDGTRRVKDLLPGPQGSAPHDLTVIQDRAYFLASAPAGSTGEALWRTDGTAAGTVLVHSLTVRGLPSWPRSLTAVGGRLFFVASNEATGVELWTSRGTAATTRMVIDLRPGTGGSYPQQLTDVGGVLVFAADDGETGLEPWMSDGTAAGTVRLGDLNPGLDASSPGPFTRAGNNLFFGAWEPDHGRELWVVPFF